MSIAHTALHRSLMKILILNQYLLLCLVFSLTLIFTILFFQFHSSLIQPTAMATSTSKTLCSVCDKFCMIYTCPACSKHFCFDHLSEHRTKFTQQVYQLQNSHDNIRHEIDRWNSSPTEHPLIKQIDQWEKDSIVRIRQLAEQYRATFCSYSNKVVSEMHMKLHEIAKHMKQIHQGEEIIEIDLKDLEENFQKLQEQWNQLRNVSVKERSTTFINQISLLLPIGKGKQ